MMAQNEILDIFDRTTGLYQTIIDKLKAENSEQKKTLEWLAAAAAEKEKQTQKLLSEIDELNETISDFGDNTDDNAEQNADYTIDAGIGKIHVYTKNMKLIELVEELDEFIKMHDAQAAINTLRHNK